MLSFETLKKETARRVARLQALMREKDLGATIVIGGGAPGQLGAARYFTNIDLWSGREFVIIGSAEAEPVAFIGSSYQAEWARTMATTSRIESPDNLVKGATAAARDLAGTNRRLGVVNLTRILPVGEHDTLRKSLPDHELVEITAEVNAMRAVKSPFEIEALFETGRLLDEAFDVFARVARPGVRVWDACAEAERHVKAAGAFWGRSKVSLDLRPYTIPAPVDRRFTRDDITVFELVYAGPWGYWSEMTAVYAFGSLPPEAGRLLDATLAAVDAAAEVARPGVPIGKIAEATDEAFRRLGLRVAGKHTPDCHSIGLDGSDGPNSEYTPEAPLHANMALSLHPATLMDDGRAYLISDNFLVTPEGATRLSPHSKSRYLYELAV
ncbi:MAG: M24 family metallopeptidase [Armatimonadota bacterium]|nr:M24 family metallopeptidase [Armatimonadota bacterium]MDR7453179.1 M24 family metallopeptidase [Armatimonadota bacterium]